MLPVAVDGAGTLLIGIDRVGDRVLIDRYAIPRSRGSVAVKIRTQEGARAEHGTGLKKFSAAEFVVFTGHFPLLELTTDVLSSIGRSHCEDAEQIQCPFQKY